MASFNFVLIAAFLFSVSCNAVQKEDTKIDIQIPEACKGKKFCDVRPEGYGKIEEIINEVLPEFLKEDYADRVGEDTKPPQLSPETDWDNCPYVTEIQSMYLYHDNENNVTTTDIIVQTKLFRQYVELVRCAIDHIDSTSDEQCFRNMEMKEFGMKTKCQTSEAYRTLYVFDYERKKVIQKSYSVPACCSCKITNSFR